MKLSRLTEWLTPGDTRTHRAAIERTERMQARIDAQEPEVRHLVTFHRWSMVENHIAPKIRAAIKEQR